MLLLINKVTWPYMGQPEEGDMPCSLVLVRMVKGLHCL